MSDWVCNSCAEMEYDLYYEATRLKIHGICEKCGVDCPYGLLVPTPEAMRRHESAALKEVEG